MGKPIPVTIDGVTLSVSEWARRNGIRPGTALSRIKNGCDPVEAVSAPPLHNTRITIAGETLPVPEWARRYGVPQSRIYQRLQMGWDPTEAVTAAPLNNRRKSVRRYTIDGVTKTSTEWCRHFGISKGTWQSRVYNRGMDPVEAFRTPVQKTCARWTAEDDARMRALWGHVRTEEIAEQLGRTAAAVRDRARVLCLPPPYEIKSVWRAREVATALGVTTGTVLAAARKLGISVRRYRSPYDMPRRRSGTKWLHYAFTLEQVQRLADHFRGNHAA